MTRPYTSQRWWRKLREQVLQRDGYACTQCGQPGKDDKGKGLHVDHIVRRARGGLDAPSNLRTLCASCHGRRSGRDAHR